MHQEAVDLRTNPSQDGGNDVDKRARRMQADVDVFFPTKNQVKIRFSCFKKFKIQIKIKELYKI